MYSLHFEGRLRLDTPLQPHHAAYLRRFLASRRVKLVVARLGEFPDPLREAVRLPYGDEGAYVLGVDYNAEQSVWRPVVVDINHPPADQPDLWSRWRLDDAGATITYTDRSNLYLCYTWLRYLLDHFLIPWGYHLNGTLTWQGEAPHDRGMIRVQDGAMQFHLEDFGDLVQLMRPAESVACVHTEAQQTELVCVHLAGQSPMIAYLRWFTGDGLRFIPVCPACAARLQSGDDAIELRHICWRCYLEMDQSGGWSGIAGQPEVRERATTLRIVTSPFDMPLPDRILDIQPVANAQESVWLALTANGDLYELNLSQPKATLVYHMPETRVDFTQFVFLCLDPDGRYVVICCPSTRYGVVFDRATQTITMTLDCRDNHHHADFLVTFFTNNGQTLLIHGAEWNRLDISDPQTGKRLTERPSPDYHSDSPHHEHYLDYFHGELTVSPTQEWIADNGWVWHPAGSVDVWNLDQWLHANVWESEDGPTRQILCVREYYMGGPLCWLDGATLAVWGYGEDSEWLIPALRIFDARSGKELRWFAGPPAGDLAFDTYLYDFSPEIGLSVWDVATGERLLFDVSFRPSRYHPGAKQFLQLNADGKIITGSLIDKVR